jgi:hypothetical protein
VWVTKNSFWEKELGFEARAVGRISLSPRERARVRATSGAMNLLQA